MEQMNWSIFFKVIKVRIKYPRGNPGFWIYFILNVIIVGGFGMWYTLGFSNPENFILSGATYFTAVIATSSVEFGLKDFTTNKAHNTTFRHLSYFLLIIGIALFLTVSTFIKSIELQTAFLIFSVLLSWFLWWIVNSDNPLIHGEQPNLGELIGDQQNVEGDLDGIQH